MMNPSTLLLIFSELFPPPPTQYSEGKALWSCCHGEGVFQWGSGEMRS